jgi:hypothetical protein
LVGLPVSLDPPVKIARLHVVVEIGSVRLILNVQSDVLLGPEKFILKRTATSIIYAQLHHLFGAEVRAA